MAFSENLDFKSEACILIYYEKKTFTVKVLHTKICEWIYCSLTINYKIKSFDPERNWVFATNPNFIIPISQQPDDVYLSCFKLALFDPQELLVWNI